MKKIVLAAIYVMGFIQVFAQNSKAENNTVTSFGVGTFDILLCVFIVLLVCAVVLLFMQIKKMREEHNNLNEKIGKRKKEVESLTKRMDGIDKVVENQKDELVVHQSHLELLDKLRNSVDDHMAPKEIMIPVATPKEKIYFTNYRPQDGCFGDLYEHNNDSIYIWKLTIVSDDEAYYELAFVDGERYQSRMDDFSDTVRCAIQPRGKIISGKTLSRGRILKINGQLVPDANHLAEVEFECI